MCVVIVFVWYSNHSAPGSMTNTWVSHSVDKLPQGCMYMLFFVGCDVGICYICMYVCMWVMLTGPVGPYTPTWAARAGLRESGAISCYKLMVGGPQCSRSVVTLYAWALGVLCIIQHSCLVKGSGVHHIPTEIPRGACDGSSWPDIVAGPPVVKAVACRLAHAVTRQNLRKWPMLFITDPTPFLLEVSGAEGC